MNIIDYPKAHARLKAKYSQFDNIRVDSSYAITVINQVRVELGMGEINISDLIISTLGRIEDKINKEDNNNEAIT